LRCPLAEHHQRADRNDQADDGAPDGQPDADANDLATRYVISEAA